MSRARSTLAMAAGLMIAILGSAGAARADEASAAESFHTGTAAYRRREYRAAALAFEAAYREQPHGAALYNAGRSWAAAGAGPRAADAFAGALRAGELTAEQEADARAALRVYEATLGTVELTAPAGALVSIEHVERARAPLAVHVAPGDHAARADLPDGTSVQLSARVGPGERTVVAFSAPLPPPPPPPPPPAATKVTDARPGAGPSAVRIAGIGLLGGALLAGGGAVALGVRALDARNAFDASGHTDQAAHDRAASLRTWTNVTWAAAGALGAAGVVLLVAPQRRRAAGATISLSPAGAAIAWTF